MSDADARPIKLLLVDDEAGYVEILVKRMTRRNIEVTGVLRGSEAIRILRRESFDAAVLDLKMDDMDGIEVLKVFKKMDPEMPVIMLTGHGSETAARQGIAFGAYDYLTKPCNINELVDKIRAACGSARKDGPVSSPQE